MPSGPKKDSDIAAAARLRILPAALLAILCICCSGEQQRFVPNAGLDSPTMSTTDVSTLISDSGYTRYHLTAPLWLMYEDADEPYWRFPDGLELEQYDLQLQPESTVECDSATYFSRMRLWRLDGNVVMVNTQRDSFLTQQLFWDQAKRKIYSDSFIHIVRTDRVIEGYGFESDQSMLYYTVNNPTAILPAERPGTRRQAPDTTVATTPDSARANHARRQPKGRPAGTQPPASQLQPAIEQPPVTDGTDRLSPKHHRLTPAKPQQAK